MLCKLLYYFAILIFGTLYPTYLSYKALKQKDDKECARMMMYWIVFSIFTFTESFLDILVGIWFPFYYETKIIFIFWLISPYGNGAKILYENFLNQKIEENEEKIDDFILSMRRFSIAAFWTLWDKFSLNANYLLVLFFHKAQILVIQYMNEQNRPNLFALSQATPESKMILEKPSKIAEIEVDPAQDQSDNIPYIEQMETESEDVLKSELTTDEIEENVKKPVKRTKRRRRITIEDISNRPVTRSTRLKNKELEI